MRKLSLLILAIFLFLSAAVPACVSKEKPVTPVTPVEAPLAAPVEPAKPPEIAKPVEPPTQAVPAKISILSSSVEPDFPAKLIFNLKAEGNANITDVRLHYEVERETFARIASEVFVEFNPGPTIDTQWAWDMRKTGGLPTSAVVEYSWILEDATGNKTETTPAKVSFDDNRYAWQSLTENNVNLYWYKGDNAFAGELMVAIQQGLVRLAENTGARLKKPVQLYIYANANDLKGAMIFPQEWTGGAAYTEFGVIIIGIDNSNLTWGKRAIVHELTHLVIHQMTFNPYNEMPTWLDEGLAVYNEGNLDSTYVNSLKAAIAGNGLISARSLSSPFSAFPAESYLSYAQSYSLVEYLISTYGQGKMLELLTVFSQGSAYDGALKKVYGFDMDDLNTVWRDYVVKRYPLAREKTTREPIALFKALFDVAYGAIDGLAINHKGGRIS